MSGGFEAIATDTKEKHPSHICYIEGVECWADEARFGGIVIQTLQWDPFLPSFVILVYGDVFKYNNQFWT